MNTSLDDGPQKTTKRNLLIGKLPLEIFRERRRTELVSPAAILGLYGSVPDFYRKAADYICRRPERLKEISRANQIWKAFASLFQMAAPCLLKGHCTHKNHRPTVEGLRTFFRWFVQIYTYSGFDKLLEYCKTMTDWGEYYSLFPLNPEDRPPCPRGVLGAKGTWLTFPWARGHLQLIPTIGPYSPKEFWHDKSWFSWILFELHLAKRGFGLPARAQIEKSLKKHQKFLSNKVVTPSFLHSSAYRFALNYCKPRARMASNRTSISVSASACIENSRSNGGRAVFCSSILQEAKRSLYALRISGDPRPLRNIFGEIVVTESHHLWQGYQKLDGFRTVPLHECFRTSKPEPDQMLTHVRKLFFTEMLLWDELQDSRKIDLDQISLPEPSVLGPGPFLSFWDEDPCIDPDLVGILQEQFIARAVDDQGCKARVITVGPGSWITLGHLFRTYLYAIMEGDREMILGEESAQGAFPEWFDRVGDRLQYDEDASSFLFQSVDLTNATDTFSSEVCQSMALGVADSSKRKNISLWRKLRILARNVASAAEIYYPDLRSALKRGEGLPLYITQERGMMMGTPESWGLLNLYNKFFSLGGEVLWRHAPETQDVGKFVWWNPLIQKTFEIVAGCPQPYSVVKRCGDDQVMFGPKSALIYYTELIKLSGAIPSVGTHVISEKFITFTQSLAELSDRKVKWVDIVRVNSLVDWKGINRLPAFKEVPRIWFRGQAYNLALRWWNANEWELQVRKSLLVFAQYLCHDFILDVSKQGGEPFLPSVLGGLGFPHPNGGEMKHIRPRVVRAIAFLLRDDQRPQTFYDRTLFNVWTISDNETLFAQKCREVEERAFSLFFSKDEYCSNLEYFEADNEVVGLNPWTDLNAIRDALEAPLPLTSINFGIIQNIVSEANLLLVPIGTMWKDVTSRIRSYFAPDYGIEDIQNPDLRLSHRIELFRKRVDKVLKEKGVWADTYDPHLWSNYSVDKVTNRLKWADSFIWCHPGAYQTSIQFLLITSDKGWDYFKPETQNPKILRDWFRPGETLPTVSLEI